jgi:uncharacterized membrane-anchored protein
LPLALLGALLAVLLLPRPVLAAMGADERRQVFEQAEKAAVEGPADVRLLDQAVLHLPAARGFVPMPLAQRVMEAMGNPGQDPRLQGLIFPSGGEGWVMTVRYEPAGYVKDDEARDWNADELLESYRRGTEASNEARVQQGDTPIEIIGWAARPQYDVATHRLAWAMSVREKNAAADARPGVNFNTYALGREGYFEMNLLTGLDALPRHQPAAAQLLAALDYQAGKRYEDFVAGSDRMAEYGIAALVAGVAAKKLGLFAVLLAFLAKFAKVIFVGLAGGGALFARWRRGRGAAAASPTSTPTPPAAPPPSPPPAA